MFRKTTSSRLANMNVNVSPPPPQVKEAKATGLVTSLAYSPDGRHLAVADANRRVTLLSVPEYEKAHSKEWGFHSARVTCVAWSPDSR